MIAHPRIALGQQLLDRRRAGSDRQLDRDRRDLALAAGDRLGDRQRDERAGVLEGDAEVVDAGDLQLVALDVQRVADAEVQLLGGLVADHGLVRPR